MATKDQNKKNTERAEEKKSEAKESGDLKKYWKIKSADGNGILEFMPEFIVNEETNEVECRNLSMRFEDKGKSHTFLFDWLNIYMFIYFTATEELRQQLATRYERKVNYIPYDVTIPITDEDKRSGTIQRRIQLPVDEVTMMVCRDEAWTIFMRNKGKWNDPREFIYKPK